MGIELTPVDAWFVSKRLHSSFPINRKKRIELDKEIYVWLDKDLKFVVEFSNGTRKVYIVKKGYRFDGASIPKIFQWLIGPSLGGPYEAPACGHDILCESKEMNSYNAGLVFNFLMDDVDIARWRRKIMWVTVRNLCQPIQNSYSTEKISFAREHLVIESHQ